MTIIDNIAIRLDLTGMLSYFYFILLVIRKRKSLEHYQDFFVKTRTKTLLFVLEAP